MRGPNVLGLDNAPKYAYGVAGVLILTSFGASPEVGLATVLLLRLVTTVPLALVGVAVTWASHLRPAAVFAQARASEGELVEPAGP